MSSTSVRLDQAADAAARDPPRAIGVMRDLGTESPHRGGGAQYILAFQQAGDTGLANRQRAEHQRPMADRLVARNADAAGERRRGPTGEQLLGCVHPGPISMEGVDLTAIGRTLLRIPSNGADLFTSAT